MNLKHFTDDHRHIPDHTDLSRVDYGSLGSNYSIQESGNLTDSLSRSVCSLRNGRVESSGIMLESHLLRRARHGQTLAPPLAPGPLRVRLNKAG